MINWKSIAVGAVIGAAAAWIGSKVMAKGGIQGAMKS